MNKTTLRYIAASGMVVVSLFGCVGKKGNSVKINGTQEYGWIDSSKTSFYVPIDSFSVIPYHYYCDTINWKSKYDSLFGLLTKCRERPTRIEHADKVIIGEQ